MESNSPIKHEQTCEKVFNFITHQENAKQNHSIINVDVKNFRTLRIEIRTA